MPGIHPSQPQQQVCFLRMVSASHVHWFIGFIRVGREKTHPQRGRFCHPEVMPADVHQPKEIRVPWQPGRHRPWKDLSPLWQQTTTQLLLSGAERCAVGLLARSGDHVLRFRYTRYIDVSAIPGHNTPAETTRLRQARRSFHLQKPAVSVYLQPEPVGDRRGSSVHLHKGKITCLPFHLVTRSHRCAPIATQPHNNGDHKRNLPL